MFPLLLVRSHRCLTRAAPLCTHNKVQKITANFSSLKWRNLRVDADSKISNGNNIKVPVLIVGGGPVGLTLSILLSKYGVRSMLVERKAKLWEHPQAHFLNNRTMEIFRTMDGLEEEIRILQPAVDQWRHFVYCSTLSGLIFGIKDHFHPQDLHHSNSPTSCSHFSQHRLSQLLFKRAQKISLGEILLENELMWLSSRKTGVVAGVLSSSGSSNRLKQVECSYLVATDGAGSSVRRLMGVAMEGERNMQNLVSIHFFSPQLGKHLLKNQPGMLYFVFNARVIAVIVAHNLQLGEFIAQVPYYPPQQAFENVTSEVCREIINDAAGIENLDVEIKTVKKWEMSAQVAESFICGSGNVILAGDAAHCFPPAGGFGMNTGIQDVHNLAWKLATILNGCASSELLLTYNSERHPVAKSNTALSVANFEAAMAIPGALGLSPSAARLAQQVVSSGASWLPERIQGAVLDGIFRLGRLQVSAPMFNESTPFGSSRIARVQQILQEGRSLQLQFPAEDLGFRYDSDAVYSVDLTSDEVDSKDTTGRKHEYVPSSRPGVRLPHCSISYLGQNDQRSGKAICSTLDLISNDSLAFLVIVGPEPSGCLWGDAALRAGEECGIPVKVAMVWPKGTAKRLRGEDNTVHLTEKESYVLHEWGLVNRQYVIQVEDLFGTWWEGICKLPPVGSILVRPDGHIAWRTSQGADAESRPTLERVLRAVLRHPLQ